MIENRDSAERAAAFHSAFAVAYTRLARQKHARWAGRLPFHAQDVHVIHGGNRWWQIVCLPGQREGDIRLGPVGRYTLQWADPSVCPELADLPDQNSPRKEEFRLIMGVDFIIYHEAFPPPEPPSVEEAAEAGTALADRLVDEHAAGYIELDALRARLTKMRNAHSLMRDMDEALACLFSQHYRAAVVTCCAAAESALVGKLEEMGHPIRQEERSRLPGHEHHSFPVLVQEAYRRSTITPKTRERLELLNGMRRGTERSRPDATAQDDAAYAWETVQNLLRELAK